MKTRVLIIAIVILLISSTTMSAQDLSSHEWKDRLLIILTSDNSKKLYSDQMEILNEDIKGLKERKLVIYSVMPNQYKKGIQTEKWIQSNLLNDRFREDKKSFEVILMGLDGGIKLRQSEVLSLEKLYGTIDAMPMRRNEIQNKKQ
jgi:hypothetical protein